MDAHVLYLHGDVSSQEINTQFLFDNIGFSDKIEVVDEYSIDVDSMLFNVTADNITSISDMLQIIPDQVFKVFIVHEMYHTLCPYLKLANLVVFFNSSQSGVSSTILRSTVPHVTLPFPGVFSDELDKKKQVFLPLNYSPDKDEDYLHLLSTWWKNDYVPDDEYISGISKAELRRRAECKMLLYAVIPPEYKDSFDKFKSRVSEIDTKNSLIIEEYTEFNLDVVAEYLSNSMYAYLWNKQLSKVKLDELLISNDEACMYSIIDENPIWATAVANDCEIIAQGGVSITNVVNDAIPDTIDNYFSKLETLILDGTEEWDRGYLSIVTGRRFDRASKLRDNVIYGPEFLRNDYIFYVPFRNQEEKIKRCIESIEIQNKEFDYGLIIVDDGSSDDSISIVMESIKPIVNAGLDVMVVSNPRRKYASKNLYNVVHTYTKNPESVIIEVDGDDYLYNNEVLEKLETEYLVHGVEKTLGSFITIPKNEEMEVNAHKAVNTKDPWDQSKFASWLALRTCKQWALAEVEAEYFFERNSTKWLKKNHDSSINPRLVELVAGNVSFIMSPLYVYDLGGNAHDCPKTGEWWASYPYNYIYHVITF
jgi:hypothetical protein